jgi:hypothetical protein
VFDRDSAHLIILEAGEHTADINVKTGVDAHSASLESSGVNCDTNNIRRSRKTGSATISHREKLLALHVRSVTYGFTDALGWSTALHFLRILSSTRTLREHGKIAVQTVSRATFRPPEAYLLYVLYGRYALPISLLWN